MDLFETLGLGPRQPEENELYIAIYADPEGEGDAVEGVEGAAAKPADEGVGPYSVVGGVAGGDAVDEAAEAARLEALRARCTAWLLPYISDYIWNKDPLVLRSSARQPPPWERKRGRWQQQRRPQQQRGQHHHASGGAGSGSSGGGEEAGAAEGCVWSVVRFGDAVDDEWWAVWLLLRMSRELQDLSVQVWDNDGQFLLIEAAYALPRWLKPETAEHRVWLRRGRLHVLPLPSPAAPDLPACPTRQQALRVLREG
ncbi:hypothetical protein Agub_g2931, partial [Astrephomene gubernaculifera]